MAMKMLDYSGKLVLAPMVRVSELPLRKLCLLNGADLVWGPEVVDKGLIASTRHFNDKLKTVDFVSTIDTSKLVWRTKPELEKDRVIFQLGSSDPELAVQAAKMVANDVAAIDLNCGCPKHFSIHSGMGAQLLKTPDLLCTILENLVEQVGKPFGIAISAKIRILESASKTCDLVTRLVKTGISCLTVHCRTTPMRPREPAIYDYLKDIAAICRENGVACLVNGDIQNRAMMKELVEKYGVDGAMIARAAQKDPLTCFSHKPPGVPEEPLTANEEDARALVTCRAFLDACIEYEYNKAHTKYNLTTFISGKSPLYAKFARAKSVADMDSIVAEAQEALSDELASVYRKMPAEGYTNETGSNIKIAQPNGTLDTKEHTPLKRKHDGTAESAPPTKRT